MSKKKTKKKRPAPAPKKSRSPFLVVGVLMALGLIAAIGVLAAYRPDTLFQPQVPGPDATSNQIPPSDDVQRKEAPRADTVAPTDEPGVKAVPAGPDMHSLLVDPRDSDHIFYGNHDGLYESFDGAERWRTVPTLVKQDAMAMDLDGGALWVAGHNVLFKGAMKGDFQAPRTDLPGSDIHGFATSASDPGTMYAFVVGHGLQKTTDGGRHWSAVSETTKNMGVHGLAVDKTDADVIYAIEMSSGLLRSTDGGKSWRQTTLPVPASSIATGKGRVLLAASEQGVFRSVDGGAGWTKRDSRPAVLVAISSGAKATAYMVDPQGRVFRSDDDGMSWR